MKIYERCLKHRDTDWSHLYGICFKEFDLVNNEKSTGDQKQENVIKNNSETLGKYFNLENHLMASFL